MAGHIRFSSRPGLRPYLTGGCFKTPSMAWGGVTPELLSICQLVSVADEEGSGCNDVDVTGRFYCLHCCVKTPFPIPCFSSTNSWNGLFGLGRARAGASSRARLSVWKACFIGSVQVQFGVSLLFSYKGRAFLANPMIYSLQYLTVPRNSLIWRGALGFHGLS